MKDQIKQEFADERQYLRMIREYNRESVCSGALQSILWIAITGGIILIILYHFKTSMP